MTLSRLKSSRLMPFLLMTVCLLLTGCPADDTTTGTDGGDATQDDQQPQEDLGGPLPGEPTTPVLTWQQFREKVAEHQGRVVVVQLWAHFDQYEETEDFAELVRLAKLFRDEDVVVMTLNADHTVGANVPPESRQEEIRRFAAEQGANFLNAISATEDEHLTFEAGVQRLPAVLIFSRSGEMQEPVFVTGEPTPLPYRAAVIPTVEALLKEEYIPPQEPQESQASAVQTADAGDTPQTDTTQADADQADAVELQILNWDQMQELVGKQKGKVVVVDLWSTNCTPCVKEFPNLVALHKKHGEKVACFSYNLDYIGLEKPEELKPKVLDFLQKQNATFTNILSNVPDEKIFEKINLASIPAVLVYGKDGQLAKRFDVEAGEDFTYPDDIVPLVEKLIAAE